MDNSPRFDGLEPGNVMAAIDFNSFAVNEMEHLARIARVLGKSKEANSWEKERNKKINLVNSLLWDKKNGFYYDRRGKEILSKIKTVSSFLPLFAGIANEEQAKSLVSHLRNREEFWSNFPVPTVALDEPSYCKDMWRGTTWVNYNYLIIEGLRRYGYTSLANQIANKTLEEIAKWYAEKGVIFEYYDSEGEISPDKLPRKEWLGGKKVFEVIKDYHWSAACYVALSLQRFSKFRKR